MCMVQPQTLARQRQMLQTRSSQAADVDAQAAAHGRHLQRAQRACLQQPRDQGLHPAAVLLPPSRYLRVHNALTLGSLPL